MIHFALLGYYTERTIVSVRNGVTAVVKHRLA